MSVNYVNSGFCMNKTEALEKNNRNTTATDRGTASYPQLSAPPLIATRYPNRGPKPNRLMRSGDTSGRRSQNCRSWNRRPLWHPPACCFWPRLGVAIDENGPPCGCLDPLHVPSEVTFYDEWLGLKHDGVEALGGAKVGHAIARQFVSRTKAEVTST
jgi:hypothetical protein